MENGPKDSKKSLSDLDNSDDSALPPFWKAGVLKRLEKAGLRFKKGYGQHFLTDPKILRGIVNDAQLSEEDYVLEVGTGPGTLTHFLCQRAGRVLTIEIDQRLFQFAFEELSSYSNLERECFDALKGKNALSNELLERIEGWDQVPGCKNLKVVANLPYNVATPLLIELFRRVEALGQATVLVQKELAERMTSPLGAKAYGPPTVLLSYWCEGKITRDVSPRSFVPPPKVNSSVLNLVRKSSPLGESSDYDSFAGWVRLLFSQRRKQVGGILSKILGPVLAQKALKLILKAHLQKDDLELLFGEPGGVGSFDSTDRKKIEDSHFELESNSAEDLEILLKKTASLRPESLSPVDFFNLASEFGDPESKSRTP